MASTAVLECVLLADAIVVAAAPLPGSMVVGGDETGYGGDDTSYGGGGD